MKQNLILTVKFRMLMFIKHDTEFITNCKQVIDTVVRLIQRYSKYRVNQVIKVRYVPGKNHRPWASNW
jgi:hypothetical protein